MKNVTRIMFISLIAFGSIAANAADPKPTVEQMRDCYRAHHQIMDKPSLQTLDACWRQHHHLMK